MSATLAVIPQLVLKSRSQIQVKAMAVVGGALALALLAQISIPLPWTPVRITGQTFGVALMALLWGRRLGVATFATYVLFGALGAPVFSSGNSLFQLGATAGYLVGMGFSAWFVGTLADRGWTRSFPRAFLAASAGSCLVFSFGLMGLAFFVPLEGLLWAGLVPFLPGDILKNLMAAGIASQLSRTATQTT